VASAFGAAAVGFTALSPKARAQSSDLEIFQLALLLELLEGMFYQQALDAGVLSGSALGVVSNLRDHELAHADFLIGAGADPSQVPGFVFSPESLASQKGVLQTAATLEPVGVGAYLGAAPLRADPSNLGAALSI
jgi:ferritin-like protein